MKKKTTRYVMSLLAAIGLMAFTGCEDNDLGDGIEEAGESVEDAAEELDN